MAGAMDMAGYAAALKHMYPHPRIENGTFKQNVTYAKISKNPNVGGEDWTRAVLYADIGGSSATFARAQANKSGTKQKAFKMTAVDGDYSLASIKGKVWRASQGNTKALLAVTKSQVDSAFNALISAVTTAAVTLTSRANISNFWPGQKLQFSASTTGAVRAVRSTVSKVNRRSDATTHITLASDPTGSGVAASDYIFIDGDAYDDDDYKCVRGLESWLPTSAPTAGDSFFSVDRSDDPVILAGNSIDSTGMTMEELLVEMAMECAEQGGLDSGEGFAVFPFLNYKTLLLELGARKEYHDEKIAGVSFRGVKLNTEVGDITIFPDRNCVPGKGFMLDPRYWSCDSIGAYPGILDLDGVGKFLREAADDAYELRIGGYPQVSCGLPGSSAVAHSLPTAY